MKATVTGKTQRQPHMTECEQCGHWQPTKVGDYKVIVEQQVISTTWDDRSGWVEDAESIRLRELYYAAGGARHGEPSNYVGLDYGD
jgi:hypothetical protein